MSFHERGRVELAPAKVNLFLHVLGRRADGYHLLDSLVVFAAVADRLSAAPARALALEIGGPQAASLAAAADNLVLRAARALAPAAPAALRFVLEKNLPVAAGIGGGSADAAAALRLLARLGYVGAGAELASIAATLGADVPVCLASRPARAGGVGERLGPAPRLPEFGLVLANPGVPLATADVFRARSGAFSPRAALPDAWASAAAMAADLAQLSNDLEPPARALCPAIGPVLGALAALPGALLARLSGSGATCFAIFATPAEAEAAAPRLPAPWWRWGGGLIAPEEISP